MSMEKNWVEKLPVLPLSVIIDDAVLACDKYGNMPGQPVTFSQFLLALRQRIQRINNEILNAKNRDDVAAAESRLKIMQEEERKMIDSVKITCVEGLLRTVYACVGHLDGQMVIVPAREWSGTIDWEGENLTNGQRQYRRLRTIASSRLTPEERELIKKYLESDPGAATAKTGAPGRPSSMHIIKAEFQRRKQAGQTETSLAAQAKALKAWFDRHHPDLPPVKTGTIENQLRDIYHGRNKD